jgi:flavin reductase (DIM6/NTAB) family NADH-FMN oxidoreductase RutF
LPISRDDLRKVMANFATGVTVVTTACGDELRGMTANAVSSVSLDPPLVLVCIDKSARTHELVARRGAFAINILTDRQEHLSRLFASKEIDEARRLATVPYTLSARGLPLLEGCLAHIECEVYAIFEAGDHSIFVGQVEGFSLGNGCPLIFFRSKYTRIVDC